MQNSENSEKKVRQKPAWIKKQTASVQDIDKRI